MRNIIQSPPNIYFLQLTSCDGTARNVIIVAHTPTKANTPPIGPYLEPKLEESLAMLEHVGSKLEPKITPKSIPKSIQELPNKKTTKSQKVQKTCNLKYFRALGYLYLGAKTMKNQCNIGVVLLLFFFPLFFLRIRTCRQATESLEARRNARSG